MFENPRIFLVKTDSKTKARESFLGSRAFSFGLLFLFLEKGSRAVDEKNPQADKEQC